MALWFLNLSVTIAYVGDEKQGKLKTKLSEKEQKQAAKDKAKKALIEKKIEEIKRKKSEKRKVAKQRAGVEQKGNVPSGKKSVSFRV